MKETELNWSTSLFHNWQKLEVARMDDPAPLTFSPSFTTAVAWPPFFLAAVTDCFIDKTINPEETNRACGPLLQICSGRPHTRMCLSTAYGVTALHRRTCLRHICLLSCLSFLSCPACGPDVQTDRSRHRCSCRSRQTWHRVLS